MTETTQAKPRRVGLSILLFLAIVLVGLAGYDAVAAAATRAKGGSPEFLFSLLPGYWLDTTNRFGTLALQLAVPGLAVALPGLLLLATIVRRRKRGLSGAWPVAAILLLANAAQSSVVVYSTLGAEQTINALFGLAPDNAGRRLPKDAPAPVASTQPDSATAANVASPATPLASTQPAAGPTAERIFFSSDRGGHAWTWDLWMMDPDGANQVRLSTTERVHMQPRTSPDGRRLAFTSLKDGKPFVLILDLATRQETEVCEGDQGSFAAGGGAVVCRRDGQMMLHDLASGAERVITPALWKRCAYPSASPDGQRLAFASRLLAGYNIYLAAMDGEGSQGSPTPLVEHEGACDPRWSPSGRQLSFQTESHICTIRPDGKDRYQITLDAGVQHYAGWSPDERNLAYCQGPSANGPWQIFRISAVEDEDPVQLTRDGSNMYPEWVKAPASILAGP